MIENERGEGTEPSEDCWCSHDHKARQQSISMPAVSEDL
jgi:hypothetical protein